MVIVSPDHVALHESAVGPEPKCRDASQRGFRSGLSEGARLATKELWV
jgi:hypothetical protein